MTEKRRLLIIGAGVEQAKAYRLAKKMGLEVVGTDMNPEAPAFAYADDCIIASTRDPDETLRMVLDYTNQKPIHGVMTIANDVPLTVASVAYALDLPGIPIESAIIAADKIAMKETFSTAGVAVPEFAEIYNPAGLRRVAKKWGFPFVIKPVDGRGARGVLRITREVDLEWAWREAMSWSEERRVMAERFVPGTQISTESVIWEGRSYTPAFSERNYEYLETFSPYIIENGGTMPAILTNKEKRKINALVEQAAAAMGITCGTVKGDIVMGPEGPVIIELAARLSGGYYATDQIPLSTGVDLVTKAIKIALGDVIDTRALEPRYNRGAAIRFFFPETGRVDRVEGARKLDALPGVKLAAVYRKSGDVQPEIKSHPDRAGFVITGGRTREEALKRAEEAVRSVRFKILRNKVA